MRPLRHQILAVVALGIFGAGLAGCSADGGTGPGDGRTGAAPGASDPAGVDGASLTVPDFESLVAQTGVQVIDVRTPEEYADGHLAAATNLDIQADFTTSIADLDKDATYALYCRSGVRSAAAKQAMLDAGYPHVVDLSGGIVAWTRAGKPVVTG